MQITGEDLQYRGDAPDIPKSDDWAMRLIEAHKRDPVIAAAQERLFFKCGSRKGNATHS
jgi:hypothetical protein